MSRVPSLGALLRAGDPHAPHSLHIAALAPNTRRAYDAQWRQWVVYAGSCDTAVIPADPSDVARWLAWRLSTTHGAKRQSLKSEAHVFVMKRQSPRSTDARPHSAPALQRQSSPSQQQSAPSQRQSLASDGAVSLATVRSAIAAVRLAHLAHGLAFDSRHPEILLALRAASRADGRRVIQACPMRAEFVRDLLNSLGEGSRACRDAALLALGYCFARRRSELVGLDLGRVGAGTGCVVMTPRTIEIHLAQSKRGRRGQEVYVVPRGPNRTAVAALECWIGVAAIAPGEPVFRRVYRSGRVSAERLDAQSVSLIIKERIRDMLIGRGQSRETAIRDAEAYAGHSLRVGFAVTAAEAGASILAIQKALGHASPTMAARYAEAAELSRMSPHNLDGVALGRRRKYRQPSKRRTHGR